MKPKNFEINSVKRVVDDVVFAVGDKIGINGTSPEIFKIEVNGDYCWLHYKSLEDDGRPEYTESINDANKRVDTVSDILKVETTLIEGDVVDFLKNKGVMK